ncbi:MAG: helix-turn-helix domain-containing protein, partial [Bacteroidota bacterium]
KKLSDEIGKPVSLMYRIKVNHLNPQLIIQQVLSVCNISYSDLLKKSNEKKHVIPRRLIIWLVTYYCGFSSPMIAPMLNIDASTVRHGIDSMNDSLDTEDPMYLIPLKEIEQRLLQITREA